MFIQSKLFAKGMLTGQPSLSNVLEHHLQTIIQKIKGISDLSQMSDSFLEQIVTESLVERLLIHFDKMSHKPRTEQIDAEFMPFDFFPQRGVRYPKQVARISIPFSGDRTLLDHTPSTFSGVFPTGEINGNAIEFDLIFYGYQDDAERVKAKIADNRNLIDEYATAVNQNVKSFNESLSEKLKLAFEIKLGELTAQNDVFGDLGIPETHEPIPTISNAAIARPKTSKAREVHIIQYIEKQYVQQLNQTNNNTGDVNNAIQSN